MIKATLTDGTVLEGPPDEIREVILKLRREVPDNSIAGLQAATAAMFGVTEDQLVAPTRARRASRPRMIAMYVCRVKLGASYAEIGEAFGGRDHTTVMNAVNRVEELLGDDPDVERAVKELML